MSFQYGINRFLGLHDTNFEVFDMDVKEDSITFTIKHRKLGPNFIHFRFLVSEMNIKKGVVDLLPVTDEKIKGPASSAGRSFKLASSDNFSRNGCSNSLTFGAPCWTSSEPL